MYKRIDFWNFLLVIFNKNMKNFRGNSEQFRVGKNPGNFKKTHGNGKNWFLPGKMGKTGKTVFFQKHA
jgi:hypothetical protein